SPASASATALPMPLPPPVTTATRCAALTDQPPDAGCSQGKLTPGLRMRALFLINSFSDLDENPALMGQAFHDRGWSVDCALLHTLAVRGEGICAQLAALPDPVRMHDSVTGPVR